MHLRSGDLEDVVLDRAAGLALEVEVDMLRHVDRRVLARHRLVVDAPHVLRGERVGHLRLDLTRKSLVAIRRGVREDDADVRTLHERLGLPDVCVPAARAAVQVATDARRRIVERGKLDCLAVQPEDALRDAVALVYVESL